MRTTRLDSSSSLYMISDDLRERVIARLIDLLGLALVGLAFCSALALATWSVADPSLSRAGDGRVSNLLGYPGAVVADLGMQLFGLGAIAITFALGLIGLKLTLTHSFVWIRLRLALAVTAVIAVSGFASLLPKTDRWPLPTGLGGALGDALARVLESIGIGASFLGGLFFLILALLAFGFLMQSLITAIPVEELEDEENTRDDLHPILLAIGVMWHWYYVTRAFIARWNPTWNPWTSEGSFLDKMRSTYAQRGAHPRRQDPHFGENAQKQSAESRKSYSPPPFEDEEDADAEFMRISVENEAELTRLEASQNPLRERIIPPTGSLKPGKRAAKEAQISIFDAEDYKFPPLALLAEPKKLPQPLVSTDALEQNARLLEGVLDDFGVRGEILNVRPGPVVTLYELEPAPGTKSARVIGLAEDIARSMSAVAARVAVVAGRNAIGIELPNIRRETVLLRELLASEDFEKSKLKLAICLGKTIGGEPVIVDLARMPHLLVAGTTGSGKSVAINTMICSLLYRMTPEECRLIMIDPKMLELSVYDGIPHLLTPVVTDPKKAVVALKWAVREMEDRYRKMSKLGVRNIDGFNARIVEAAEQGEVLTRTIQTGYDKETGEALYEEEVMALEKLPYIVVIVDEMADLMLVAGKEIEGAVQRLAQMARAAGIHIVMATQRPSVDVITGTIKANFPTRISFQVTSKIDSRTILGEMGAEQLLGQGDMLYMAGGGRISRVHGPFISDQEVEKIVDHLKTQGRPNYIESITADTDGDGGDEGSDGTVFDKGEFGDESADLYDQAVAVVLRDKKASTSYVQRRLQIGYNRAASLIERMEREGVVGAPNHAGKREILMEASEYRDED